MVRLTSNTTGSTVDGEPLPEGFKVDGIDLNGNKMTNAWKSLDGDENTRCNQFGAKRYWEIDFGCEVSVAKLRVLWSIACYSGSRHLVVQYEKNGNWEETGSEFVVSDTAIHRQEVSLKGFSARKWRLYRPVGDGNNTNL